MKQRQFYLAPDDARSLTRLTVEGIPAFVQALRYDSFYEMVYVRYFDGSTRVLPFSSLGLPDIQPPRRQDFNVSEWSRIETAVALRWLGHHRGAVIQSLHRN